MSNDFYTFDSTPRTPLNDSNINGIIDNIAAEATQYDLPSKYQPNTNIGSTDDDDSSSFTTIKDTTLTSITDTRSISPTKPIAVTIVNTIEATAKGYIKAATKGYKEEEEDNTLLDKSTYNRPNPPIYLLFI